MGTTANLDLPYPDPIDLVKDGAAAIQALAEAIEAAIWSPFITLQPVLGTLDDEPATWSTAHPDASRGAWSFLNDDTLIVPPTPGVYLVTAQAAGVDDNDRDIALSIGANLHDGSLHQGFAFAALDATTADLSQIQRVAASGILPISDPTVLGFELKVTGVATRISIYRLSPL